MPKTSFTFNGAKLALDARPDRLDLRDRIYTPRVRSLPPQYPEPASVRKYLPAYMASKLILDQGSEGACTGFGLAALVNYLFWARDPTAKTPPSVSPRMLYHLAQFYDEWPGEDYSGSSCRGALKGWHKHGVCARKLWPYTVDKDGNAPKFEAPVDDAWALDALARPLGTYYRIDKNSVTDLQAAILEIGAIYVSASVHDGWDLAAFEAPRGTFTGYDQAPVIAYPSGGSGGHAFSLVGYTERGFVVQNSWGPTWGYRGFAILTYADWVANGTDAWAAALGVPIDRGGIAKVAQRPALKNKGASSLHPEAQSAFRAGFSLLEGRNRVCSAGGVPFFDCLTSAGAYAQTIVMGNDGGLINRIVDAADAVASVERIVHTKARDWFAANATVSRLAIYAHGGLNAEADSIERIRVMAPYFLANAIYPVFVTWKTGWAETLGDVLVDKFHDLVPSSEGIGDWARRVRNQVTDATDRALEAVSEECGVKTQWTQMKQNALAAADASFPRHGLVALADRLQGLAADLPGLEIHLVGHSAGALVHGNLLGLLQTRGMKAASCTLYAPACTIAFANRTYRPAIEAGLLARDAFHIHLLSDDREVEDTVGGVYRKSLLYLVARALEVSHKTPLLGMLSSFDGDRLDEEYWNTATLGDLQAWNRFYWGGAAPRGFAADGAGLSAVAAATLHVEDRHQIDAGPRRIPTTHGSFDNDVDAVGATLARIVGVDGAAKLKQPVLNLDY